MTICGGKVMRRIICLVLFGGIAIGQLGCVVALGNRGALRAPYHRTAVAVDGDIYIVDLDEGTKCKVDEVVSVSTLTETTVETIE